MSSITKVFVIVNCMLSVLFLGFAATLLSQQWDYRQMYLDAKYVYQADKETWDTEKKNTEGQVAQLKKTLNERTTWLKEFQDKYNTEKLKNDQLSTWTTKLDQRLDGIERRLGEYNQRLEVKDKEYIALVQEKEEVQNQVETAQESAQMAFDELNTKVLEVDRVKGRLAETEKMLKRARRELWESKEIVRAVRDVGINIDAIVGQVPPLEGQIVEVSPVVPIVMLSIGENDKVKKGYQFTVYRGSNYIGQVVVEETYPDMSAARINKEMTKRAIKKGDKVTTKIGGSF